MTDTTTTLSLGTQDGDKMDESLVVQPGDGVTQAKRPRVHIGGSAGAALVDPVNADPGASPYALPTLGVALVDESPPSNYAPGETRALSMTPQGRLRVILPQVDEIDFFGADEVEFFAPVSYAGHINPWGF